MLQVIQSWREGKNQRIFQKILTLFDYFDWLREGIQVSLIPRVKSYSQLLISVYSIS